MTGRGRGAPGMEHAAAEAAAHEALRRAYEAAYRFPPGFGGFGASVYYAWDREGWAGSVEARSPSDVRYEGAIRNADGQLHWEVGAIINQCWRVPYEETDGRMRLSLDGRENPLGRLLRVEDGLDSAYRIQGGRVSQIERRFGDIKFSINIQERTFTEDGRALPAHFCVVYWSVERGRVIRTDIYRDGYIKVEGIYLPLGRRITTADDSGVTSRQILFRDHNLLLGASSGRPSKQRRE